MRHCGNLPSQSFLFSTKTANRGKQLAWLRPDLNKYIYSSRSKIHKSTPGQNPEVSHLICSHLVPLWTLVVVVVAVYVKGLQRELLSPEKHCPWSFRNTPSADCLRPLTKSGKVRTEHLLLTLDSVDQSQQSGPPGQSEKTGLCHWVPLKRQNCFVC